MEEFKELEFKYKADNVSLVKFVELMNEIKFKVRKDVSSWDHYYTHADNTEEFIRFRDSDNPELTIKRKVRSANNWERVEVDLPLNANKINKLTVDSWTALEGYKSNFTIYKSCFIFWQEIINTVYYVVYDENMTEQGRFIEIEVNKDKVQNIGIDKAFDELKQMEKKLIALGINPQNRLKKSLFEMFVR